MPPSTAPGRLRDNDLLAAVAAGTAGAVASEVDVRIRARRGERHVVSDNGVGGADRTSGTGISCLADRVEVLRGCLDVESPPRAGTRVHASIPLAA